MASEQRTELQDSQRQEERTAARLRQVPPVTAARYTEGSSGMQTGGCGVPAEISGCEAEMNQKWYHE